MRTRASPSPALMWRNRARRRPPAVMYSRPRARASRETVFVSIPCACRNLRAEQPPPLRPGSGRIIQHPPVPHNKSHIPEVQHKWDFVPIAPYVSRALGA